MYNHSLLEHVFHETALLTQSDAEFESEFEVIKEDTRVKINDTLKAPFKYICSIRLNGDASGTGTLIGPKTVLTAGHVVWDKSKNKMEPLTSLTVIPAMNGNVFPKTGNGIFGVSRVVMSKSNFKSSDIATLADYAIIHLKEPAGSKYGYWGRTDWKKDKLRTTIHSKKFLPLPAGELKLNLCGYAGDEDRDDRKGDHQWLAYDRSAKFSANRQILEYYNDTFGGHSGSPVWVRRHSSMGGHVLVGVHIARINRNQQNKIIGTGNQAVYINDTVRKFIAANML